MNDTNNPRLRKFAQALRREMTPEERHLWYDFLKKQPITFHRQMVIGEYIADFYCAAAHLVIELDGRQHGTEEGRAEDAKRDAYMAERGLTVLRYTNKQVHEQFSGICQEILKYL